MRRRDFLRAGIGGRPFAGTPAPDDGAAAVAGAEPEALAASAVRHFISEGRTCGESLLLAGCQALALESELVPDIALGVAGGVGLRGKTCGAVTGAAIMLGVVVGRREDDYLKKLTRTMAAAGALCQEFESTFGSTECRKLCGLDLTTPEGIAALEAGVKAKVCRRFVEAAARLLARHMPTA